MDEGHHILDDLLLIDAALGHIRRQRHGRHHGELLGVIQLQMGGHPKCALGSGELMDDLHKVGVMSTDKSAEISLGS